MVVVAPLEEDPLGEGAVLLDLGDGLPRGEGLGLGLGAGADSSFFKSM